MITRAAQPVPYTDAIGFNCFVNIVKLVVAQFCVAIIRVRAARNYGTVKHVTLSLILRVVRRDHSTKILFCPNPARAAVSTGAYA